MNSSFRKLSPEQRRNVLLESLDLESRVKGHWKKAVLDLNLADIMTETSVGFMEIPLGIVLGLPVNGRLWDIPLATEEPSVVAAASYAARILSRGSGIQASADEPVMRTQIFLENCAHNPGVKLEENRKDIEKKAKARLISMERRGGGFRNLGWKNLPSAGVLEIWVDVDVRDAMGANLLNDLAEFLSPTLESITSGKKLMAILSNDAAQRIARAEFQIDVRFLEKLKFPGIQMAERIVLASKIAQEDAQRAVTHNKGIMNGISGLALATGNDTRAIEAAIHSFAARSGSYKGLSEFHFDGKKVLSGNIEIPLALATVGGALGIHPTAKICLALLGNPDSKMLCSLAAALGLAQNFAALFALTGEGIQEGHMNLQGKRSAYLAGASGPEIEAVARELSKVKNYSIKQAEIILKKLRRQE